MSIPYINICRLPRGAVLQLFLNSVADTTIENDDSLTPLCLGAKTDDPNCGGFVNQYIDIGGVDISDRCNGLLPKELADQFGNENVEDVRPLPS